MALTCARAGRNMALTCANLPIGSLRSTVFYANHSDISFTYDVNGNITAFAMAASTFLYKWEGPEGKSFVNTRQEQRQGNLLNGFGHFVDAILPSDAQLDLNELANLNSAKIVAITMKEQYQADPTFRVHGENHGLVMSELTGDDTGSDNDGLPGFVLATPEGSRESAMPRHMLTTDFATTLAAITAALAV